MIALGQINVGGGGGSGGAIRLLADSIQGAGTLTAIGGGVGYNGGAGRIRLEANTATGFTGSISGELSSTSVLGTPFPGAGIPTVRISKINGQSVSTDPQARFVLPDLSLSGNPGQVNVEVEATNLNLNPPTNYKVFVRITPRTGAAQMFEAQLQNQAGNISTWLVQPTIASGISTMQVRAAKQ